MNIKNLFKNILLASHPVGSIFITTDGNFDPHEKWGGAWELLEDSFLVGAGNTYALGATGGEATHTLTVDEIPSHQHGLGARSGSTTGSYYGQVPWCGNAGTQKDIQTLLTGGGQAHNNLPPYTAVNMWLRTA